MEAPRSIQDEVIEYLRVEELTISDFSKMTGINRGVMSQIIVKVPPKIMSINMLDMITKGMGHPEGYYYANFIEDCFRCEKTHGRRTKPFLLRSAELGRLDIIQGIVDRLAEDQNRVQFVYDCAEILYEKQHTSAAAILYKCVVEIEKKTQSSRLALSCYRLFLIHRLDKNKGIKSAIQFMPYRQRLPESIMLEAILQLANFFILRDDLDEVERLADELHDLASGLYRQNFQDSEILQVKRPLVYYYGQSYLLKDYCCELSDRYKEALFWIDKYEDLSWMERLNQEGKKEVERFTTYAKANRLSIAIKLGDQSAIPAYLELLKGNEQETVQMLTALLESSNKYRYNIDSILHEYRDYLEFRAEYIDIIGHYKEEFQILNYANLSFHYSLYCFRNHNYKLGITKLLECIENFMKIANEEGIHKKMSLFEHYRKYASMEQATQFNFLCRRMWNDEEKSYGLDFSHAIDHFPT